MFQWQCFLIKSTFIIDLKIYKNRLHKLCMFLNNVKVLLLVINYLATFKNTCSRALVVLLRHFSDSFFYSHFSISGQYRIKKLKQYIYIIQIIHTIDIWLSLGTGDPRGVAQVFESQ